MQYQYKDEEINEESIKDFLNNEAFDMNFLEEDFYFSKKGKNKVLKIIEANEEKWIKEYQENLKKKILNLNSIGNIIRSLRSYGFSCRKFEHFYDLSKIIKDIILSKKQNYNDLFKTYYDIIFNYEKYHYLQSKLTFGKGKEYGDLLSYFKINNQKYFRKIIDDLKEIVVRDNFKPSIEKQKIIRFLSAVEKDKFPLDEKISKEIYFNHHCSLQELLYESGYWSDENPDLFENIKNNCVKWNHEYCQQKMEIIKQTENLEEFRKNVSYYLSAILTLQDHLDLFNFLYDFMKNRKIEFKDIYYSIYAIILHSNERKYMIKYENIFDAFKNDKKILKDIINKTLLIIEKDDFDDENLKEKVNKIKQAIKKYSKKEIKN